MAIVNILNRKFSISDESDLISWDDGYPYPNYEEVKITSLYKEEYAPLIEKFVNIFLACEWQEKTIVSTDWTRSSETDRVQSVDTTSTHWVLVKGDPLPWMSHRGTEDSVRHHAVEYLARKDGSYAAALKEIQENWIKKALAKGATEIQDGLPPGFSLNQYVLQDLKDWGYTLPEGTIAGDDGDEIILIIPGKTPIRGECTEDIAEQL